MQHKEFRAVIIFAVAMFIGCGAPQDREDKISQRGHCAARWCVFCRGWRDCPGCQRSHDFGRFLPRPPRVRRRIFAAFRVGNWIFALANAAISYFAVRGEGAWGEKQNINAVMTLAPNVALFIAPQSAGVNGLGDLKGKRVVVGPAGAGFEYFLRPILNAHGVTYDDFTPLHNTQAGTVDMLADGFGCSGFFRGRSAHGFNHSGQCVSGYLFYSLR